MKIPQKGIEAAFLADISKVDAAEITDAIELEMEAALNSSKEQETGIILDRFRQEVT